MLAGIAKAVPRSADGEVEMLRTVKVAKDVAVKARSAALISLRQVLVNAPAELREQLEGMSKMVLIRRCAVLRPGSVTDVAAACKHALRAIARRWLALDEEIRGHEKLLGAITGPLVPELVDAFGVGPDIASEGMIGYVIEQELGNLLPPDQPMATILTMTEVDPDDPAFRNPTKFVGPVYTEQEADALSEEKGCEFNADGEYWRRVVPSPEPERIFEIRPIRWLLEHNTVVVCTGGRGIPTMFHREEENLLIGIEAVIDKDLASELLAREVGADLLVMATDVDGVYADWGTPQQRRLDKVTADELSAYDFPAGSMGPKIEAATRFVRNTGARAAIGALADIERIVEGQAGTQIVAG